MQKNMKETSEVLKPFYIFICMVVIREYTYVTLTEKTFMIHIKGSTQDQEAGGTLSVENS